MIVTFSRDELTAIRACISIVLNDMNFDESDFDYRVNSTRERTSELYGYITTSLEGNIHDVDLKKTGWYSLIQCLSEVCHTIDWEDEEFFDHVKYTRKNIENIMTKIELTVYGRTFG